MATFSKEFLSNLGNPAMTQGMLGLGQAVGGIPGQIKARKKEEAYNTLMKQGQSALTNKDSNALASLGQQLLTLGFTAEGEQFGKASRELMQKQKRVDLLTGTDLTTPGGQQAVYDFAAEEGDIVSAVKAATQRKAYEEEIREKNRLVAHKVNLSNTALELGLDTLAKRIGKITDPDQLREIAKEMRALEIAKVPTESAIVRKRMAEAAGITAQEFLEMGLAGLPDKEFKSILAGEKGTLKPFMLNGKVTHLRVNEFGKVWDDVTGRWSEGSKLGVSEAPPQVQIIENIASGMADELAKIGAKNFAEAYEGAKKSAAALSTINRSLPKLDVMFTGAGAEFKLNAARWGRALGVPDIADPSSIENTELYIADSGQRVADYITNLGAGTGLSDADREYAKSIVGGNVTVDKAALKRLLGSLKRYAEYNIKGYKDTRERIRVKLGEANAGALTFFPDDFYVDTGPIATRDPKVDSYFPDPTQ